MSSYWIVRRVSQGSREIGLYRPISKLRPQTSSAITVRVCRGWAWKTSHALLVGRPQGEVIKRSLRDDITPHSYGA